MYKSVINRLLCILSFCHAHHVRLRCLTIPFEASGWSYSTLGAFQSLGGQFILSLTFYLSSVERLLQSQADLTLQLSHQQTELSLRLSHQHAELSLLLNNMGMRMTRLETGPADEVTASQCSSGQWCGSGVGWSILGVLTNYVDGSPFTFLPGALFRSRIFLKLQSKHHLTLNNLLPCCLGTLESHTVSASMVWDPSNQENAKANVDRVSA